MARLDSRAVEMQIREMWESLSDDDGADPDRQAAYDQACATECKLREALAAQDRLDAAAPDLLQIARSALSCWGFMASNMALPADERQAATVMAQAARKTINLVEGGAE